MPSPSPSQPSILVIDDDPITRTILQRVLEQYSYPLTLAQHGEEGLALARQMRPALVICDLNVNLSNPKLHVPSYAFYAEKLDPFPLTLKPGSVAYPSINWKP